MELLWCCERGGGRRRWGAAWRGWSSLHTGPTQVSWQGGQAASHQQLAGERRLLRPAPWLSSGARLSQTGQWEWRLCSGDQDRSLAQGWAASLLSLSSSHTSPSADTATQQQWMNDYVTWSSSGEHWSYNMFMNRNRIQYLLWTPQSFLVISHGTTTEPEWLCKFHLFKEDRLFVQTLYFTLHHDCNFTYSTNVLEMENVFVF